jgi:hypothetical protein
MTDPLTASTIAALAFQEFIKSGAGELAKKFTGEAIAKMEQLRELIWSRLTGKHPAADNAIEQAQAGEQAGVDTVATLLGVEMLDEAFAGQVRAIGGYSLRVIFYSYRQQYPLLLEPLILTDVS